MLGSSEIHVIEDVEEFCTELQVPCSPGFGTDCDGRKNPTGWKAGPSKVLRPTLPNCPGCEEAKAPVLNQHSGGAYRHPETPFWFTRSPEFGLPIRFGRLLGNPEISGAPPCAVGIAGVVNGEGRVALEGDNSIHLPVAEDVAVPVLRFAEPRQIPLVTENKAMPGIEHGTAALAARSKGDLGKIVYSGSALRREPVMLRWRNDQRLEKV